MKTAAGQICWVPIEMIVDVQEAEDQGNVVVLTEGADGSYTLVSGRERLRHMHAAGQRCVDAVLSPVQKFEEKVSQLLDEQMRGEMHYLDEAEAYRTLLAAGVWNTEQLAQRIGRTPATIRRKLRLLKLGEKTAEELRQSGLCERYAQELLRIPGAEGRLRVLRHVTEGGLSVKETEKLVDELLSRMPVPVTGSGRVKPMMRDYRLYVNAIRGIVEQMCDAGLDAHMQVTAGRHVAEVRIAVPVLSSNVRR